MTMTGENGQPALIVPAWLDGVGLGLAAFRVLYHHVRRAREGQVETRRYRASKLCCSSPKSVRAAEAKLTRRGWLEPRGSDRSLGYTEQVFVVRLPEPTAAHGTVERVARAGDDAA